MDIQVKNLSRSFSREGAKALDDLGFEIASGSRIGLVGPNGSGKTTLMRALMGLLHSEGDIRINQMPLDRFQAHYKRKVSYVPQIAPTFNSRVSSIVETALRLKGTSMARFQGVLNGLNLDYRSIAGKPFRRLSGGMKQKVMISMAFCSDPELIFLDEPTSSLDAYSRESFYKLCSGLGDRVTLVLTSHRIDEIRHIINHCVELDKGSIQFQGSTLDYLTKGTLCLIEVLPEAPPSGRSLDLSGMGFSASVSGWWSQLVPRDRKFGILRELQSRQEAVKDFLVRDIEAPAKTTPLQNQPRNRQGKTP